MTTDAPASAPVTSAALRSDASARGTPSDNTKNTSGAVAAPVPRAARRLARSSAVAVILVPILVLIGWVFNIDVLKRVIPGRIEMNPVVAVCFIILGTALWLAAPGSEWKRRSLRPASAVLVVIVFVAAAMRFAGYILKFQVPVDRLLFPDRLGANVMAPNTAVCFMLLSWSLLLTAWDRPVRFRAAPVFALLGGGLALLALTGYVYGVETFYHFSVHYVPMALNSAIVFLILAGGILACRPDYEPIATVLSDTIGGVTARRILPAAFLIPLLTGWLCLKSLSTLKMQEPVKFGFSLFTLATITTFVALIWWNTRFLHRIDRQRRTSERQLRNAEAVYHSLVETLPQNIFRKDLEGRFTFGNRNFCTELGRPLAEIIGKTDFDFFSEALAHRYRGDDIAVIETGIPFDKVEEHVTPGGNRLYVQVIKTPVRDRDGRVIGVQGIFWDVTDRVTAQEELEKKNRQLEETNDMLKASVASEIHAHETSRAAHEALKQTQSQLVQTEKLAGLGQMVAGVAHEINNPLSFVSNNVAVLQRDVKALAELLRLYQQIDPMLADHRPELAIEIKELTEAIDIDYTLGNLGEMMTRSRDGLKRIQQIVKDLRDFARLDEADLNEVDLNAGIESTLNIIHGHAKKRQIKVEKQLSPLPPVACYPAKINQVVMNLVGNAIDASPDGSTVIVRTSTGRAALGDRPEADVVRIEVVDQGTGISPQMLERIFDPFFTTKPPGQGTGLGLSISYGIVRDHEGRIDVDSTPGKGSTFAVTLPVEGPREGAKG